MKEKTTPLEAAFSCKKHHTKLVGQRIILEEGTPVPTGTTKGDTAHAFEKLNDPWGEEIQENNSDKESSDKSESDSDTTNETIANKREIENENKKIQTTEMQTTRKAEETLAKQACTRG
jgi:hypothetical protein